MLMARFRPVSLRQRRHFSQNGTKKTLFTLDYQKYTPFCSRSDLQMTKILVSKMTEGLYEVRRVDIHAIFRPLFKKMLHAWLHQIYWMLAVQMSWSWKYLAFAQISYILLIRDCTFPMITDVRYGFCLEARNLRRRPPALPLFRLFSSLGMFIVVVVGMPRKKAVFSSRSSLEE